MDPLDLYRLSRLVSRLKPKKIDVPLELERSTLALFIYIVSPSLPSPFIHHARIKKRSNYRFILICHMHKCCTGRSLSTAAIESPFCIKSSFCFIFTSRPLLSPFLFLLILLPFLLPFTPLTVYIKPLILYWASLVCLLHSSQTSV